WTVNQLQCCAFEGRHPPLCQWNALDARRRRTYSSRRLRTGSTVAARKAGATAAVMDTTKSKTVTDMNTERSSGVTLINKSATTRVVKIDATIPRTAPNAERIAAR